MAECNWDPKKHGGRPCPVHGGGGLWDENVFIRQEKLKKAGYTDEDLKDEDLKEDFDDDYENEFGNDIDSDDDLDGGIVEPGERASEANKYKHTVNPDKLIEALNSNNPAAEYLLKIANLDLNENLNNKKLDKNSTVKHWNDILNKIDISKINDEDIKKSFNGMKEKLNSFNQQSSEKEKDLHENAYMFARNLGYTAEEAEKFANLAYENLKK